MTHRTAHHLAKSGLAHIVASDAHGLATRGPGMTAAAASLNDPELARWLTVDLPGAVASGGDWLPPRPEPRHRRRRMFRRR
jgi:hypothetical protein